MTQKQVKKEKRKTETQRIYLKTKSLINKLDKDKDKSFPMKVHHLMEELWTKRGLQK